MVLQQILNYSFGGNLVSQYLIALGVFVLAIIVLKIFKNVGIKKLKKLADHTRAEFDDILIGFIESVGWLFYFILALDLALRFIQLPEIIGKIVYYLTIIIVIWYVVKAVQEAINFGAQKIISKRQKEDEKFEPANLNLLAKILKGIVWMIAVILILQNLGYNISALVAGLGIGGVAIAFALQNILGDIFASFSIYFDKPFQVGDFIIVGNDMGIVKNIGIKSTRIQTLQGQELVVSNKELTETRVNNYKQMEKRRITFGFGVEYETPTEKLKKIPQIVKDIIDNIKLADLDRVHFKEFGDFSLDYEVVYYLATSDYNKYMDTQQEINLTLKQEFEKQGIVFAYPTQTVYLNKIKD